jgi:hypothetical protein
MIVQNQRKNHKKIRLQTYVSSIFWLQVPVIKCNCGDPIRKEVMKKKLNTKLDNNNSKNEATQDINFKKWRRQKSYRISIFRKLLNICLFFIFYIYYVIYKDISV